MTNKNYDISLIIYFDLYFTKYLLYILSYTFQQVQIRNFLFKDTAIEISSPISLSNWERIN